MKYEPLEELVALTQQGLLSKLSPSDILQELKKWDNEQYNTHSAMQSSLFVRLAVLVFWMTRWSSNYGVYKIIPAFPHVLDDFLGRNLVGQDFTKIMVDIVTSKFCKYHLITSGLSSGSIHLCLSCPSRRLRHLTKVPSGCSRPRTYWRDYIEGPIWAGNTKGFPRRTFKLHL